MKLDFFDCNAFIGQPARAVPSPATSAADMLGCMDSAGIARAVVWHVAQRDYSATDGNRMLSETIGGQDRLRGCWTILPTVTGELSTQDMLSKMKAERITALRAFPDLHRFILNWESMGNLMEEVIERQIPLMLSMQNGISWPAVSGFLRDYPDAVCILCDLGVWSMDRMTWPLLDAYEGVYLETSMLSLHAGALEATAERFGAHRLVFGTGLPLRYPEAPMLQLVHARISDEEKQLIASGNLDRIISEVEL